MTDRLATYREVFSDPYEIEREYARAGMAISLLGRSVESGQQILLKVLRSELAAGGGAERFLREAGVLGRLDHHLIIPIVDSGNIGGVAYIVTPFIQGESLQQRLARERQLSVEHTLRVERDVAEALSYAHAQGVLHRDIKPANIFLTRGRAMLTDFTLAETITGGCLRHTAIYVSGGLGRTRPGHPV
jgi:serine/threonine protein kinase